MLSTWRNALILLLLCLLLPGAGFGETFTVTKTEDDDAVEFDARADSSVPTVIPTLDRVGMAAFGVLLALVAGRLLRFAG